MGQVRTAAKALITRNGRLLVLRCRDASGEWYSLPGGGQEEGETLLEALRRECREEIGAEIEVVGLRFVRDHIAANHTFTYLQEAAHQVEHLFECRVADDYRAGNGPGADTAQVDVVWLDAAALSEVRVYPGTVRAWLDPGARAALPIYWGDVE